MARRTGRTPRVDPDETYFQELAFTITTPSMATLLPGLCLWQALLTPPATGQRVATLPSGPDAPGRPSASGIGLPVA